MSTLDEDEEYEPNISTYKKDKSEPIEVVEQKLINNSSTSPSIQTQNSASSSDEPKDNDNDKEEVASKLGAPMIGLSPNISTDSGVMVDGINNKSVDPEYEVIDVPETIQPDSSGGSPNGSSGGTSDFVDVLNE